MQSTAVLSVIVHPGHRSVTNAPSVPISADLLKASGILFCIERLAADQTCGGPRLRYEAGALPAAVLSGILERHRSIANSPSRAGVVELGFRT